MKSVLCVVAFSTLAVSSVIQQSPESRKPLVSSAALEHDITSKNLFKRAKQLYKIAELGVEEYGHPTRVIGSKGHVGTVDYVQNTLSKLAHYYDVSNQTFEAVTGNILNSSLTLGDDLLPASAMSLTPPTKDKAPVNGPLVLVANLGCDESDYPANTTGSIALISRGECPFGQKSANAGKAGALAAVVYNNIAGNLSGTLGQPEANHVATFGITLEEAQPYITDLKAGKDIPASAYIDAIVKVVATTNVMAQTRGGDQDNCVMLGGHSDSVTEGPGINDDGSGTIALLEIAVHLAKYKVNNCVRFAWWAAEEEGLLGSDYYVSQLSEEENLKIRLFMDYDMLASPNFAYQVYNATNAVNPVGSEELRDLYTDYYTAHGQNFTYIEFNGRSDYDAFIVAGIPAGGIATGAEGVKTEDEVALFGGTAGDWYDPCYHQLCDDLTNLAIDAWEFNSKLIAHSVATYAISFDGFPKRIKTPGVKRNKLRQSNYLYHGPDLVM
ncbi:Peptide hydrolase [Venustampulla echinocandica]|uniref:Peptide hydrolase n=1 Tax=Venustampulla echinocandica TaxID=2656787 RepID=A0A370TCA8_9HELO|nr:Peptide hydrolase [Venustampulla echinocandica]RDL31887.1 Peptide hydrolase [Venustampulla echinocandica]